jgi:hypothetical protein
LDGVHVLDGKLLDPGVLGRIAFCLLVPSAGPASKPGMVVFVVDTPPTSVLLGLVTFTPGETCVPMADTSGLVESSSDECDIPITEFNPNALTIPVKAEDTHTRPSLGQRTQSRPVL